MTDFRIVFSGSPAILPTLDFQVQWTVLINFLLKGVGMPSTLVRPESKSLGTPDRVKTFPKAKIEFMRSGKNSCESHLATGVAVVHFD